METKFFSGAHHKFVLALHWPVCDNIKINGRIYKKRSVHRLNNVHVLQVWRKRQRYLVSNRMYGDNTSDEECLNEKASISNPVGNYMFKVNNRNTLWNMWNKNKVWNMFKVINKDTRTTLLPSFWYLYC